MQEALRNVVTALREVTGLIWSHSSSFVRRRFAAVVLLVLLGAILSSLGPVALKLTVDRFTGQGAAGAWSVLVLIPLYVVSQWLARAIGEIRGFVYARAERRLFRLLSEDVFRHVMRLPLRWHLNRQTGAINQTIENGLQGYQLILHHLVFTVLPVGMQLATIAYVLLHFRQSVFLGIFSVAILAYAVAFSFFSIFVERAAKSASSAHVDANAVMTDSVINYETVKFFAAESVVQRRVSTALTRTEKEWVGFYRSYAKNGLVVATLYALLLGTSVTYAAWLVTQGRMTVGDFVLVNTYMLQIMQPVEMLGYAVQGFAQGAAMLDRMIQLLKERPEPGSTPESAAERLMAVRPDRPACLEFEHVAFSYRIGRPTLRDVSFVLPAGRTVGIVGASGAGKSSLVRLIVRLLEPDAGRILLDGVPIRDIALDDLRNSIAVVPQDTVLFNESLAYNIAFSRAGCTRSEVEDAAKVAQLHDFISAQPAGYDTPVGERGVKLSGGERQRVSIARAALKRPRIYIFDEATSSLDSRTEQDILSNLRHLAQSSTTLIIAHRLSTVVHADEILVLDAGSIVERGTHADLLAHGGRYAALWRAQHGASAGKAAVLG
jgi:ABC-type transport system involved in Fe-S cluster assembly fused permease/ATPase subunit